MIISCLKVKFHHMKQNWMWRSRKTAGKSDPWSFSVVRSEQVAGFVQAAEEALEERRAEGEARNASSDGARGAGRGAAEIFMRHLRR